MLTKIRFPLDVLCNLCIKVDGASPKTLSLGQALLHPRKLCLHLLPRDACSRTKEKVQSSLHTDLHRNNLLHYSLLEPGCV